MPLEFIYLNSPLVVTVNCDNRKAMGKEEWHKVKFEKSTKNDSIEFTEQKTKEKRKTNKQTNKKKQTYQQTKKDKMEIKF